MKHLLHLVFSLSFFCAYSQIEVSEINYNSDSTLNSGNWVEFHNAGNSSLNLTSWIFTDANPFHVFSFPTNTVIAAGGYLVVTDDTVKFKNVHPTVTNVIGEMSFGLSNKSDTITIYNNNGSVVYNMAYFDSTPWQKTPDGMGRTLELRTQGANPNLPESWFAGCMAGSPGRAYSICNDPIIFSEINYNSILQINSGDWVELHNTTSSTIDISNWELKDKRDTNFFKFSPGTILAANGYLVVCNDTAAFKSVYPNVNNYVGQMQFNFSNAGEAIRLFNAQTGKIQYSLFYNDKAPWPLGSDGQGYTLELISEDGIANDGDNWRDGCLGGSPGRAYDPGCGTGIKDEKDNNLHVSVYHIAENELLIDCDAFESNTWSVALMDITGRVVFQNSRASNNMHVSTSGFSKGIYLVKASNGSRFATRKFVLN